MIRSQESCPSETLNIILHGVLWQCVTWQIVFEVKCDGNSVMIVSSILRQHHSKPCILNNYICKLLSYKDRVKSANEAAYIISFMTSISLVGGVTVGVSVSGD